MEERTVLNRENIQYLIEDPDAREQMDLLLQNTDGISWVVRLCPSGENFEVTDGVITTTCVTRDIPLTADAIRGAREMLGLLITSMFVHHEDKHAAPCKVLEAWDELTQRRKETCAVTEEYYAAAESVPHDVGAIHALKERAAAIGNEISCETGESGETVVSYLSYTLKEYPFDPLTEPHFGTNGVWGMWRFVVPQYWHLLVALVSYDEHQVKAAAKKAPA